MNQENAEILHQPTSSPSTVRTAGSWNYYRIDGRDIISVAFYNGSGIKFQTRSGILEKGMYGEVIRELHLEKPLVRKIKFDFKTMFSLNQPFYANGQVSFFGDVKTGYILYLPYIDDDWLTEDYFAVRGATAEHHFKFTHKTKGYVVDVYAGSVTVAGNAEFIKQVREIAELFVYDKHQISDISIIENREQIKELIRNFKA